jgi:hypothetical protein
VYVSARTERDQSLVSVQGNTNNHGQDLDQLDEGSSIVKNSGVMYLFPRLSCGARVRLSVLRLASSSQDSTQESSSESLSSPPCLGKLLSTRTQTYSTCRYRHCWTWHLSVVRVRIHAIFPQQEQSNDSSSAYSGRLLRLSFLGVPT